MKRCKDVINTKSRDSFVDCHFRFISSNSSLKKFVHRWSCVCTVLLKGNLFLPSFFVRDKCLFSLFLILILSAPPFFFRRSLFSSAAQFFSPLIFFFSPFLLLLIFFSAAQFFICHSLFLRSRKNGEQREKRGCLEDNDP